MSVSSLGPPCYLPSSASPCLCYRVSETLMSLNLPFSFGTKSRIARSWFLILYFKENAKDNFCCFQEFLKQYLPFKHFPNYPTVKSNFIVWNNTEITKACILLFLNSGLWFALVSFLNNIEFWFSSQPLNLCCPCFLTSAHWCSIQIAPHLGNLWNPYRLPFLPNTATASGSTDWATSPGRSAVSINTQQ